MSYRLIIDELERRRAAELATWTDEQLRMELAQIEAEDLNEWHDEEAEEKRREERAAMLINDHTTYLERAYKAMGR
jgi:hypothetical protein